MESLVSLLLPLRSRLDVVDEILFFAPSYPSGDFPGDTSGYWLLKIPAFTPDLEWLWRDSPRSSYSLPRPC